MHLLPNEINLAQLSPLLNALSIGNVTNSHPNTNYTHLALIIIHASFYTTIMHVPNIGFT